MLIFHLRKREILIESAIARRGLMDCSQDHIALIPGAARDLAVHLLRDR